LLLNQKPGFFALWLIVKKNLIVKNNGENGDTPLEVG
jgi:hypothetical protein